MIARIEHWFRRWRRRLSRSEWAIRVLGLPVSSGTGDEPGVVLIQIDGLSRRQMERALSRGHLPFLRRLWQRENYELRTFYPGLPSSTPAVQAELHYGVRCAVPGFGFFDRAAHKVFTMYTPHCAREIQDQLERQGEGLLQDGSSWSNIYSGGATATESHFCAARLGFHDVFGAAAWVRLLTFPVVHFPSLIKVVALLMVEFFIALWDLFRGVLDGESLVEEFKAVFKRVFVCIGLRELLTIGVKIDVARGLPVIHVNFLGYDEQAHRRGPASAYAHWSLAGIDRAIKNIFRAARRSGRRNYQIWIFSDHGQEATRPFDTILGKSLEAVVSEILTSTAPDLGTSPQPSPRFGTKRPAGGRSNRRGVAEWFSAEVLALFAEQPFTVAAVGPVGHLYFKTPLAADRRREVALRLVREGKIPAVLMRNESGATEWIDAHGSAPLPAQLPDTWPHPPGIQAELRRDLPQLCAQAYAGDLILLGWAPGLPPLSFASERGSHAGLGPEETQGFVLLPTLVPLPNREADFVRPADLRAAVQSFLGRRPKPVRLSARGRPSLQRLRVMTYNVHSCLGMDGRISPQRIAEVIEHYHPDLVALQELDLGRLRSLRHDQPKMIAEALGMHVVFCPTVIEDGEQYGHGLLSHFPMEVIRTDRLQSGQQPSHVQPRGALWVKLGNNGVRINLMNTHFGLRQGERLAQAADLLGAEWIGGIDENQPVILCGDFNMFPRSAPYRALTQRLRDVQAKTTEFTPLNTFSTLRPMVRIDHIFVSRHFVSKNILVPRNHLTRVASDHLPLIADLEIQEQGC